MKNKVRTRGPERLYKSRRIWVNWKQLIKEREAQTVVKGLTRKVIIVKSPNPKIFEQAIFIVRDDYLSTQGVGQKELLRQAREAANDYAGNPGGKYGKMRFPPAALTVLGAGAASAIWMAVHFFGIL